VNAVRTAVMLMPLAGVAFLWFMGVLRNRLGAREDKFFATIFLGSGLLFVAGLSGAACAARALVETAVSIDLGLQRPAAYFFGHRMADAFMNVFGIKMAAAFMFSTCTLALRTGMFPRWLAFSGFAAGLLLLMVISNWTWIALLFPVWILAVSVHTLLAEFSRTPAQDNTTAAAGRSY